MWGAVVWGRVGGVPTSSSFSRIPKEIENERVRNRRERERAHSCPLGRRVVRLAEWTAPTVCTGKEEKGKRKGKERKNLGDENDVG